MEQIKIVWNDDDVTKIAKGIFVEENDSFITVASEDGANISVSKKFVVSIRRYPI